MTLFQKAKNAIIDPQKLLSCVPGNFVFGSFLDGVFLPKAFGDGDLRLDYLSKAELLADSGKAFDRLILDEDRPALLKAYVEIIKDPQNTITAEFRLKGNDQRGHWVGLTLHRIYEKKGLVIYGGPLSDFEQKKAEEEEALKIRQMYDDAAEAGKMIVWAYDPEKHIINWIDSGYTKQLREKLKVSKTMDNAPSCLLPYIHKDDQKFFLSLYEQIDQGVTSVEGEFRFLFPNQSAPEWEKIHLRRIYDEKGNFLEVNGWSQNITERKEAEKRYQEAYEQLDRAYPNSLGSFRLNLSKDICRASKGPLRPEFNNLKSIKVDELFFELSKIIADEDIKKEYFRRFNRKKLLEDFDNGINKVSLEYPTIRADGRIHYSVGNLFLLRNPSSGEVEGITYGVDIDEEKKNQMVLDGIIANAFDYVGLIDVSCQTFEFRAKKDWITFAPVGKPVPYQECCKYLCQQAKDPFDLLGFEEVESVPAIVKALNNHGPFSLSYTQEKDDKIHCYQLHYSWLNEKMSSIMVIRSDITEAYLKNQKQIADLKEAKEEADKANQAKTDFLSRMSHDIRTPLNGIIGMTYLTEEMDLTPEVKKNLDNIDTSSKFLLSLVNDILDMAKAESGKLNLHPELYPVEEFERYVRAIAEPLCRSRYQAFSFKAEQVLSEQVPYFDKLRLNQIVFNLLSNASKYTPPHGDISCLISEKAEGNDKMTVRLEIKDNGIGMSQEFLSHLYEPFHQASGSDRAEMRGTGLGLPIIKKLVDAMGGTITVQSELNRGTTFVLDFTVKAGAKEDVKEKDVGKSSKEDFAKLKGKHVLVCEDNPINQEIARQMLTEKGLLVTIADDGDDGIGVFERSSHGYYSLIFMDIRMPKMGGLEATQKIRALPRSDANSIPIFAMTADAFSEDIQKFQASGMNGYLLKPIEPEKLYKILLSYIS